MQNEVQNTRRRYVLKLSGEALREEDSKDNISPEIVNRMAEEIAEAYRTNEDLELAIVIGGGNFWRGASASARGMDRSTADYVGMLATVMNALALESAIQDAGVPCVVQSAIHMDNVAEPFIRRKAENYLAKRRVVIFAGGIGSPFFSTDTTVALRANEMNATQILKATGVDGVYDADPRTNPDAKRYENVTFTECLTKRLGVMDATAFSLCMENDLPIQIFSMDGVGNIVKVLSGECIGTVVSN